jgi:L-threonylcarbamoyladenylate synthase
MIATELIEAGREAAERAARTLAAGGLVAFPTETVYGLGADATNGTAVARLYAAKGRPAFNPLISHVPDLAAARALARLDGDAERLAAAFWPGPLTLVLPKAPSCPVATLATAGLDTIALRAPDHPVALIVDGGAAPMGLESTIVACLDRPMLLRPGALPRTEIERIVALSEAPPTTGADTDRDETPIAPGQLASHYAPRARLRLAAPSVHQGEALLAFGPVPVAGAAQASIVLNLSERGDLIEAAANLFSHLRALDASGATTIAVMPVPREGLGEAINDRLARAAAPR